MQPLTPSIAGDTAPGIPEANASEKIGTWRLTFARLAVGMLVMITAEVASGSVLGVGIWNPWTLLVTYWLYFAHFFFFTTLAVRTGRTSLPSLYLWGVLFGLYESWITKVIWNGYSGDGKLVLGSIGPFGASEISMSFFFHPVMAFILPLSLICLFCPAVRNLFPDLAWFTSEGRRAKWVRVYLILGCVPAMAMNSGGPVNLVANVVVSVIGFLLLWKWGRPAFESPSGRSIVVFGRWGGVVLCCYLGLLYGVAYNGLRPESIPSGSVQFLTLMFYVVLLIGLLLHRRVASVAEPTVETPGRERKKMIRLFATLFGLAFILSFIAGTPIVFIPLTVNMFLWIPLGFVITALAFWKGRNYSA